MEDTLIENPWNIQNLKPPRNHFENLSSRVKKVIKTAVTKELGFNLYRDKIYIENIALSKFLSQRRNKYRNDKGFKTITKIDKAINRIYQLDLPSILTLIKLNLVDTFVPSKQFYQWLLIKLQSYAKLLNRVNYCCQYSATMLNHRLHTGHNWVEVTLALSMISRIWAISKFLLNQVNSTYEHLYSVFDELSLDMKEKEWPYNEYKLPENLDKWLSASDFHVSSKEVKISAAVSPQCVKKDAGLRKKIGKIQSHEQLKKFLVSEMKKRSENVTKKKCISKNLDALQWHMFSKNISKWIRMLKKSDNQRRDVLLKKIKHRMLIVLS